MCSLLAGPAAFSVFFRLPLSPRPWGVKFHGYRAQNAVVPERQRFWVIGSAPLVASPLLPGHRSPPQPHVSPVGPSARPAGAPGPRPPLPAPGGEGGDGSHIPPSQVCLARKFFSKIIPRPIPPHALGQIVPTFLKHMVPPVVFLQKRGGQYKSEG